MEEETSTWCVGAMMSVLGVLGVILAGGARDDEMYVFGLSLTGLAVAFVFNLVRVTMNARENQHD